MAWFLQRACAAAFLAQYGAHSRACSLTYRIWNIPAPRLFFWLKMQKYAPLHPKQLGNKSRTHYVSGTVFGWVARLGVCPGIPIWIGG